MRNKKILVLAFSTSLMLLSIGIETKAFNIKTFGDPFEKTPVGDLYNVIADKPIVKDSKTVTQKIMPESSVLLVSEKNTPKKYPKRKGVILVTGDGYEGVLPTGHAAIVYSPTQVVEALNNGVAVGKNDWYKSKHSCAAGSLYKTTKAQDAEAADWCKDQVGKPYNFDFYNMKTRSKFYCSQLIWASYIDNFKIDLNMNVFDAFLNNQKIASAIHPYELLANPKTYLIYKHNWEKGDVENNIIE